MRHRAFRVCCFVLFAVCSTIFAVRLQADPGSASILPSDDVILGGGQSGGAAARQVAQGADQLRIDELVLGAQMAAQNGQYEAALEMLRDAQELDPDNKVVDRYLRQMEEKLEETQSADMDRERLEEIIDEARRYEEQGELYRARNAYGEALRLDPDSDQLQESVARVGAAIAAREQQTGGAAASSPDRIAQLSVEADTALAQGEVDQAAELYHQILAIDPGNRGAQRGLEIVDENEAMPRIVTTEAADDAEEATEQAESERGRGWFFWRRDREEAATTTAQAGGEAGEPVVIQAGSGDTAPEGLMETDVLETTPVAPAAVPRATEVEPGDTRYRAAPRMGEPVVVTPVETEPVEVFVGETDTAPATLGPNVSGLLAEAEALYNQGQLEDARELWAEVLAVDPDNIVAETYLENTQAEYEALLAARERQMQNENLAEAQRELLNSPLTIQTDRPTPLAEFMRLVSFSTAEELEYYIAEGAATDIFANFVDRPLHEVLDVILLPKGLTWSINESNLITIELDLKHRAFSLTPGQVVKIRSLLDSGHLQNAVWGQAAPPAPGVEITLDERQRVLLVVGSDMHLQKVEDLLSEIERIDQPELDIAFYKIREDDGPKIKSLINAIVTADRGTPFEVERRIFIDGTDLIVRDTPENIAKIEELLLDNDFIEGLREETLEIANFSLVPRDFENQNTDQVLVFTARVVEMIKTLLYSRTGVEQAEREGRRLWYDPSTLQLTVIDTPTNIARVGNYVASLPELAQRSQQRVIFLEHAVAEVITGEILALLGLGGPLGARGGGEQVVARLRRGEIFTFRDFRIRLIRVEAGDPDDRFDDEAQINIISGTSSSDVTVRELNTVFFEDLEITAEEVQPSGSGEDAAGRTGEGTARILFRFVPEDLQEEDEDDELLARLGEQEQEITVQPFGPLNALIIRFENPALFNDVLDLIQELDKPTPQVEVETRFVQVNEARAREFSADFSLTNFFNDADLDTDLWQADARFGQSSDDGFDPGDFPLESPFNSSLLSGRTALDLVLGDGLPGLSFQLRMLEAEGVLNLVNGPKVTMLDGVEGEFRIESFAPDDVEVLIFEREDEDGTGTPLELEVLDEIFELNDGTLANEDASNFDNRIRAAILLVTPEITSPKSIIFDVTAEIVEPENFVGGVVGPEGGTPSIRRGDDPNAFFPTVVQIQTFGQTTTSRKLINTTARIPDGGTMVLGGWSGERTLESTTGVPVLRNMPYVGKLLFSRNQRTTDRTTLLIFLTGHLL